MKKSNLTALEQQLSNALELAKEHLEYCGYGDKWERECAEANDLEGVIEQALDSVRKKVDASS